MFIFLFLALLPLLAATQSVDYLSDDEFEADVQNVTTYTRQQHNASALAWNETLADYATNYVQGCNFAHSGGPYGENIAAGYPNATAAVQAWANEVKDYDFSAGQFGENTGHFTQLVWKATTSVGCGRANCSGKDGTPGWFVACEYYPRGNVIGNFTQNVEQGTGSGSNSAAFTQVSTVSLVVVCLSVVFLVEMV